MAKPCSWPCCLNAHRVTSMFLRRQQAIRTQTEQSFMGARWTPVAIALCHSTAGTFGLSTVFVPSPQPPSQFQAMWTSSEPSRGVQAHVGPLVEFLRKSPWLGGWQRTSIRSLLFKRKQWCLYPSRHWSKSPSGRGVG